MAMSHIQGETHLDLITRVELRCFRGEKVTNAWLLDGEYQLESRGKLYRADIHVKTPFDPANNRYILRILKSKNIGSELLGYRDSMTLTRQ